MQSPRQSPRQLAGAASDAARGAVYEPPEYSMPGHDGYEPRGQFLTQGPMQNEDDGANFVMELHHRFDDLRPIDGTCHGERRPFVLKDLKTAN